MAENETLAVKSSTGLDANLAAMLTYIPILVSGIVFWIIEKDSSYVRFHAMQSILLGAVWFVLWMIVTIVPFLWMIYWVVWLLGLALWIILLVKAYQGERFKLPVIGDIAEKQAGLV